MAKTLTESYNIFKEKVKNFNIKTLKFEGLSKKILFKCLDCGEIYDIKIKLDNLTPCKKCRREQIKNNIKQKQKDNLLKKFGEVELIEEYKDVHSLAKYICPIHGEIIRPLIKFNTKHKCLKCAREEITKAARKDLNYFINEYNKKFKYKFEVIYYDSLQKSQIKIICPKHGEIFRTAHSILCSKHECQKCRIEQNKLTRDMIIERFVKKHGNKYDYSKFEYNGNISEKSIIICPIHGEFLQSAWQHYCGCNCPDCANIIRNKYGFNSWLSFYYQNKKLSKEKGHFYILDVKYKKENFLKIGITKNGIKDRYRKEFKDINYSINVLNDFNVFSMLKNAQIEVLICYDLENFKIKLNEKIHGYTEIFDINSYNKILEKFKEYSQFSEKDLKNIIQQKNINYEYHKRGN